MFKSFLIIVLLSLGLSLASLAQTYTLQAEIQDKKGGEAMIGAGVIIEGIGFEMTPLQKPTDAQGKVRFDLAPGNYSLKVLYIGFEDLLQEFQIQNTDLNLGVLKIEESTTLLKDAEIETISERAEQIGDTTQFNANAYKVNQDANAESLLEKMPGMTMENGRMKAQGEDVQQVLVDGKPFFGNDPNAAMKNIPAEMIDKVQVYDQQSQQSQFTGFDDGETKKTINIVTKPEFRIGTFGRVYGGVGDDGQYKAGGVVNSFKDNKRLSVMAQINNINNQNFASEDLSGVAGANMSSGPGGRRGRGRGNDAGANVGDFLVDETGGITETQAIGINYTDKWGEKTDFTASYFFNRTVNNSLSQLFRQYIQPGDSGQVYTESNLSTSESMNHRFNLRMKHAFNENNTLVIQPSISFQQSEGFQTFFGETRLSNEFLNSTDNNFDTELTAFNLSNDIDFSHKFKKEGRTVNFGLRQRLTNNDGLNKLYAINKYEDILLNDTLDQQSDLLINEEYYRADISYTEPISKSFQLMLNYRPSIEKGEVDKATNNYISASDAYSSLDTALTSTFNSTYTVHEFGPGLRFNKGKSINLMARAYYQESKLESDQVFPTDYQLSRNFSAILPMIRARFNFKDNSNLFFFYRGSRSAPSVSQLQDVIDNSNPLSLSTGNSALDQSSNSMFYTRYSATNKDRGTVLSAYFRSSFTNDYIGNSTIIATRDIQVDGIDLSRGTSLSKPINLQGQYSHAGSVSYGMPVKVIKSNLNLEAGGSYSRTPGLINQDLNISYAPSVFSSLTLSSSISEKFDFTLSTRPSWTFVDNTLTPESNSRYLSVNSKLRLYWNFYKDFVFRSELSNQQFSGLSDGFDQNFSLLSVNLGYKFLPENQAEINISVFDALKQNNSISRTVSETTIDDLQTTVLQRYFMLNFIWTIKDFGKKKPVVAE